MKIPLKSTELVNTNETYMGSNCFLNSPFFNFQNNGPHWNWFNPWLSPTDLTGSDLSLYSSPCFLSFPTNASTLTIPNLIGLPPSSLSSLITSPSSPPPPSLTFPCRFCARPFLRRTSLRRHELLHTGLKPYSCQPCQQNFSRKDILARHQKSARCISKHQNQGAP